jgi:hypothetical protein
MSVSLSPIAFILIGLVLEGLFAIARRVGLSARGRPAIGVSLLGTLMLGGVLVLREFSSSPVYWLAAAVLAVSALAVLQYAIERRRSRRAAVASL